MGLTKNNFNPNFISTLRNTHTNISCHRFRFQLEHSNQCTFWGPKSTLTSDLEPEPHALVFGVRVEGQSHSLTSVDHGLGHVATLGHWSAVVSLDSDPVLARTGRLEEEEGGGDL